MLVAAATPPPPPPPPLRGLPDFEAFFAAADDDLGFRRTTTAALLLFLLFPQRLLEGHCRWWRYTIAGEGWKVNNFKHYLYHIIYLLTILSIPARF